MLGISDYGAFCAAILVFLALPGPGTFALLSATGQGGFRGGAAATAGIIVGDQVLLWLAVAGVSALLAAHPQALHVVQWAGGAWLVWIGLQLVFAGDAPGDSGSAALRLRPSRFFRQTVLITVLNPKAIVFYMAFFPLFIDPARHLGALTFVAMGATIVVLTAAWCLMLARFAVAVQRHVASHAGAVRWLRRATGGVLVAFGLKLGAA